MPDLSVKIEDRLLRKTARGATAASRGKQPILVQTECVSAAFPAVSQISGRSRLRLEQSFPKPLRDATRGPAVEHFSSCGPLRAGRESPRQSVRLRPAAVGRPAVLAPELSAAGGPLWPVGGIMCAAAARMRERTVRHCRRRAINEKGNAGQCTPARRESDCNCRERSPRRAVHRAQQSRKLCGEYL